MSISTEIIEEELHDEKQEKSEIRSQISDSSTLNFAYIFMNVMSTIIACYGLLLNSTAVVIGAMLIAALLGPITGIALGLVDGNNRLLKVAFTSEVVGVITVLLTAFIIGSIHHEIPTGDEIASRTAPNIMDLIVALAGGTAGAYATVKPKISAGLIGVAISTALVPPLSVCSILFARGQYDLAFGGFLLFFANFAAIQFSSSVVFWLTGYHDLITKDIKSKRRIMIRGAVSLGVLIILTIVLGVNFFQSYHKQKFEQNVRAILEESIKDFPVTSIADVTIVNRDNKNVVTAVLQTPRDVTEQEVQKVEELLPTLNDLETELHVRSLLTTETTKTGKIIPKTDNNIKPVN